MEIVVYLSKALCFAIVLLLGFAMWRFINSCWILPNRAYRKLRRNGFKGPTPSFPLGNITDMMAKETASFHSSSSTINHDIHSTVFPHFARWQKLHGKVFIYWLGTEPFLYIADPEFLKEMSAAVMAKRWGKPAVFKSDREPMFGNGLTMVEGDDWVHHRQAIAPAFSPSNLKVMTSSMVESITKMLDRWSSLVSSGKSEIEAEEEILTIAGEVIAKIGFSITYENGSELFEKLRTLQFALFDSNRYVGVPFSNFMYTKKTLEAKRLGKEIDSLLVAIINAQKNSISEEPQRNFLAVFLANEPERIQKDKILTVSELVDECKTIFFGGHDTTALALIWTFLLLAMYPKWQNQLRQEIKEVIGDKEIDATMLSGLKKVGWVMNEVLRLYPSAPNTQRQAREDIQVDNVVIPKGTNLWIDVVAMHHDGELWGDDVNEFRPERFKDDLYGGSKHKMGYLPFGFGGRMCVGRNLAVMEYKIFLSLFLARFSFTLSPNYRHSPATLLTLRPSRGLPVILQHI